MKPWIIAHRGGNFEASENTRYAFDKALTYAIEGLELNVEMTSDSRSLSASVLPAITVQSPGNV